MAFFSAIAEKYAPLFPDVREFCPTTSLGGSDFLVGFYGYKDAAFSAVTAYGLTFEEAAAKLRERLGTPEQKAAKLREEAAAMLAEADKLSAKTAA